MYKRINYKDRIKIESMFDLGYTPKQIAKQMNRHVSTIYRELEKGYYMHTRTDLTEYRKYSCEKAQRITDKNNTAKGPELKLGSDFAFTHYVSNCILKLGWSPDAITGYVRRVNLPYVKICTTTLYKYIDLELIPNVTNKNLCHRLIKKKRKNKIGKRPPKGTPIDIRPEFINSRSDFGHWEMDSVVGNREAGQTLLCLTERLTLKEIIVRSSGKTCLDTKKALDKIESSFGKHSKKIFKTITVDNGTEFSDEILLSSDRRGKQNKQLFYCHPYSAWERGSNENQNNIIRRFIKKGSLISEYSDDYIKQVEEIINGIPRKKFNYCSSDELFEAYVNSIILEA